MVISRENSMALITCESMSSTEMAINARTLSAKAKTKYSEFTTWAIGRKIEVIDRLT